MVFRKPARSASVSKKAKQSKNSRRNRVRKQLFETLEDRRVLAVAALPDQLLPVTDGAIYLAPGNFDTGDTADLVAVARGGNVDVAFNNGSGAWDSVEAQTPVPGPILGATTGLIDGDPRTDLILQSGNQIHVLTRGDGSWNTLQTIDYIGTVDAATHPTVSPQLGYLGSDFQQDLVAPLFQANRIAVLAGDASGFGAPVMLGTDGVGPTEVLIGDFIGGPNSDVIVGHADGSVTFFEGDASGNLQLRTDLSLSLGLGAISGLAASDLDADGHAEIVISAATGAVTLQPATDPLSDSPIRNGSFDAGLSHWDVSAVGQQPGEQAGRIHANSGIARFAENQSFLTTLSQTFIVPENPQTIEFDLVALGLDDIAAGQVPDAFEVSLLAADSSSIVPTHQSNSTAFVNFVSGEAASTAPGVTLSGRAVTLDITALTPGTAATLVFDLIGNPDQARSTAGVDNVRITPDIVRDDSFTVTPLQGPFASPSDVAVGDVDGDGFQDIVIADAGLSAVAVFNGQGTGTAQRAPVDIAANNPSVLTLAPLTAGDSILDIAAGVAGNALLTPLVADTSVPTAILVSPSPSVTIQLGATESAASALGTLQIQFSEAMFAQSPTTPGSASNPAAYSVYNYGPDGIDNGGAGDDIAFAVQSADYDAASSSVSLTLDSMALNDPLLAAGSMYRVVIAGADAAAGLRDLAGNRLDGGQDVASVLNVRRSVDVYRTDGVSADENERLEISPIIANYNFGPAPDLNIDRGDGTNVTLPGFARFPETALFSPHVYADNGTFDIEVSVLNSIGVLGTGTVIASISNVAPTVPASASLTGTEGTEQSFDFGLFSDPGYSDPVAGSVETFYATIDWQDGSPLETVDLSAGNGRDGVPSTGRIVVTHTYANDGIYNPVVTVFDDDGGSATLVADVTIANAAPTLGPLDSVTVDEGTTFDFAFTASDAGTSDTLSGSVDWGDGTTSPATATFDGAAWQFSATHTYADNGSYQVTLSVGDGTDTSVASTTATVASVAPAIMASDVSATVGQTLTVAGVQIADPGFAISSTVETFTASIDWGDGSGSQPASVVNLQPGSVGTPTRASITADHIFTAPGTYTATVTVTDDDGAASQAQFTVAVQDASTGGAWLPTLDFEFDAHGNPIEAGDLVGEQWADWGIHIQSAKSRRPAMIFDSANPTGNDNDLGTPHRKFGGPGRGNAGKRGGPAENRIAQDNILIISKDGNSANPNDHNGGGDLIFDFDMPVMIDDVGLLDLDNGEHAELTWFDDAGNQLGSVRLDGVGTGGGQHTAVLNARGASRLVVHLSSSGAVTNVVFCRDIPSDLVRIAGASQVNEGTGYLLNLDARQSTVSNWKINWGDGTSETVGGFYSQATHVYADGQADYTISATAFLDDGSVYLVEGLSLTVANVLPELMISGASVGEAGEEYSLDLASTDPGADTIQGWLIDWGDGSVPEAVPGSPSVATHTYATEGTYTIQAHAFDEDTSLPPGQSPFDSPWVSNTIEVVVAPDPSLWLPTIDFERAAGGTKLNPGDRITDQFTALGMTVSTLDASRPAMIFNSAHPTGHDKDLGTPNAHFGGPGWGHGGKYGDGINKHPLKNVLIISEDNHAHDPDDNYHGGTLVFDFDQPVMMDEVHLLDITNDQSHVRLYAADGSLISDTYARDLGDNSFQVVTLDAVDVSRMEIILASDGAVAAIVSCRGGEVIQPPATRFFVVDKVDKESYRYAADGGSVGQFELNHWASPRGAATTAEGNPMWVVSTNKKVHVYDTTDETELGAWYAKHLFSPEGIATDGTDVWIVDSAKDRVYKYTGAAARRSGYQYPSSSFQLTHGNSHPKGITTDGNHIWVVDAKSDKVFVYDMSGNWVNWWNLDSRNRDATGLTILPGQDGLWVVDSRDDVVYTYDHHTLAVQGSQSASSTFPLAPGNNHPEGIADPAVMIDYDQLVNDEISVPGEIDEWTFPGVAGTSIVVDFTRLRSGPLTTELVAPDGTVVYTKFGFSRLNHDAFGVELLQDGDYTLRASGSGEYSFYITRIPDPVTFPYTLGTVQTETITGVGGIHNYEFAGTSGQEVFLDWIALSDGATVRLIDPASAVIASGSGLSTTNLQLGWQDLSLDGTYTLQVENGANASLDYSFELALVPPTRVFTTQIDDVISGTLQSTGSRDHWVFDAVAGQRYYFDMINIDGAWLRARLVAPDGSEIANRLDFVEGNFDFANALVFDQTGQYRIELSADRGGVASYEMRVWSVPEPDVRPLELGQVQLGSIETPGRNDVFTFMGTAGQQIYLDMQQIRSAIGSTQTLSTELIGPDGSVLFNQLDFLSNGHDTGPFTLPADGEYQFRFGGRRDNTTNYQFRVNDVPPGAATTILQDEIVTGAIDFAGQTHRYEFDAVAGQQLTLDLIFNAGFSPTVPATLGFTVLDPAGNPVVAGSRTSAPFTAPVDGTYTLIADDAQTPNTGDDFGRYSFRVTPDATTPVPTTSADLVVSGVTATRQVVGSPAEVVVSWTVTNSGTALATDNWADRISFSSEESFGGLSVRDMVDVASPVSLAPGESYQQSAIVTLPEGVTGEFWAYVQPDVLNEVFEDQSEYDGTGRAAEPTSVFANAREPVGGPAIDLVPEDGSRFPVGSTLAIAGNATGSKQSINAIFVVDVSASTLDPNGLDANFDGLLNDDDDINNYPNVGDVLDVEIAATLRLAEQLASQTDDLQVATIIFAGGSEPLDSGADEYNQVFVDPTAVDYAGDRNLDPDFDFAMKSLWSFTTGFTTSQGAFYFRDMQVDSGTLFDPAMRDVERLLASAQPADRTLVYMLTDGQGLDATAVDVTGVADQGVEFYAFQIGAASITTELDELVTAIDNDASSSASAVAVSNPEDLSTELLNTLAVDSVTINGTPVDALDPAGNFFSSVTLAPGENQFTVTATSVGGGQSTEVLTLYGDEPGDVIDTSRLVPASDDLQPVYTGTTFNRTTDQLHVQLAAGNQSSTDSVPAPIVAVAQDFAPSAAVEVDSPERILDGDAVWLFDTEIAGQSLTPGATSDRISVALNNPLQERFGPEVIFLGPAATAPAFASVPELIAPADQLYIYTASVIDADGDVPNYQLLQHPPGMSIDAQSGQVTWTPTTADTGYHSVLISVDDGRGGTAEQRFTLLVPNNLPNNPPLILTQPPASFVTVGEAFTYSVVGIDPDGDPITLTLGSGAPAGATLSSGRLTWTPGSNDIGQQTITVIATDDSGATGTQTFDLRVLGPNTAPTFVSTPIPLATAGLTYRYSAVATDTDDRVEYSLIAGPAGLEIDSRSGQVRWEPGTTDIGTTTSVVIRATDARGLSTDQAYDLLVAADTLPPRVAIQLSQSPVNIGDSVLVTVSASDNVAVDSLTLTVDGQAVALDGDNQATITVNDSGAQFLAASATDTSGNSALSTQTLLVLDPSDTTPPVVAIESPDTGDTVTYLTDVIATVTDENLYSYTLEYSRRYDNSWSTISSATVTDGSPIDLTSESAGVFDPTLLQNDQYELRLTASDVNGNTANDTIVVSLDGAAKIGVNAQPVVDLTIPVAGGPPISIYRQHSQLTADLDGDFGNGWQFCASEPDLRESVARTPFEDLVGQFAALAFKEGDKVYITTPDCMRVGFTFSPVPHTGLWTSVSDAFYDPRWIPDPGHDWSLYGESDFTTITGVASGVFDLDGLPLPLLRTGTGEFILGAVNASYNPLGYELINKQGVRYSYDHDDGLEQVTDRNGNTLTYTDTAITSSSGQQVQFQRDDQGRITTLIDPQGNQTNYTYDAAGNLINVDYPEGLSNSYRYTAQNFLAAVNPENIPAQESITTGFEYDVAGRLAVVFDALGATNQFTYDLDANTRVTFDALGHPTTMTYDDRGNMTSETSPNDDTVFYEYDSDDNVTRLVDERGFETLMTYDANRNLTSVTDALNNTTEFTYNTLNDIVRMVDADGGIHEYDFDSSSNMVAVRAPGGTNATIEYDSQGRVTAVTDVEGRQRLMSYGSGPYPTQYTERDGSVVSMVYDTYGHLMQYTDPRGHSLTISMDDRQRPIAHTDALGNSMQFEFDGARVTKVIDQLGNATEYILDGNDRPIQIIDPEGGVMVITYDANGRQSTTTDANGFTTSYQYRPDGRLESMTNAEGGITRYEYDPVGNRTAEIDENGNRWQWEYDALGYVTASITPKLERTEFTYDNMGNLTSETDALGRVTTYEYGDLQLPTRITDPANGEIALTYDWEGNLLSESDKNGNLTAYTYDALNRMLTSVDPLGNISSYQYDASGNQTAATDRRGNTTSVTYDALDRPVAWTDPTGAVLSAAYDAKGRLISMTDPTGATRSYAYDGLGRLTAETDPLGGIATWTYDAVGNVLSATDPIGRTTTSLYDSLHRRISMTDPLGATTSYDHDAVGNVVSVTDPEANTTTFAYDQLNRIVSATDALGNVSTTSYNAVGYIDAMQDRNGRLRSFAFDALDRPVAELWIEGGSTVNSLSFSYDAVGNILTAADGFSAYAMTYDALNRPLAVNNLGTPGLPNVVLTHTYDASGNRTKISDNAGVSVESTYDVRNLLASRTWSGGSVADASLRYGYDSRGLPVAIQRYASLDTTSLVSSTSRDFDAKGRLTDLTHFDPVGNALVDYDYVRDLADQLVAETHHGRTYDYTRDAFGQLTGATVDSVPTESYTYDANGNRTTAGVITGADNRLLEDDTYTFDYDAEGNLVVRTNKFTNERTEYEYDHRNRMTQATDYDSTGNAISEVTNIYDVFDRQIGRIHDADAAGPGAAVHRYTVYDGPHAWADYDESGTVLARYMFGDGIDEITARWRPADGTTWYLSDHLGTVRDHIDATGTITNTIEYDSFGRILAQSNAASSDRFTFTGREYDEALDLYYYRARFYDPSTGRFLSRDPLGFAAGDTNLYRYVGNNPLDYVDPSGNLALTECAIVRYATGALNVACPVLQTALNDGFDMEGLTPAEQLAKGTETAFNMLNLAFGTLPFGSGPATQLILKAVTITTTAKSLAGTLANGHLFTIMGMAETYAREAYRLYDQGLTATFGEALNAYHSIPNKPLFWSEIVCGAANMALMVYSARARCFVEGTPVVVGILPPAPNTQSEQSSQASIDSPYGITILDCLAGVAIAGALAVRRRKKQPTRENPMHNHPVDDYFSELDEQPDAAANGGTALAAAAQPLSAAPLDSCTTESSPALSGTALAAGIPARTSLPLSGKALAAGATTSTNTASSPATKSTRCKDTRSTGTRAQQSRTTATSRSLLSKLALFGCLLAAVAFASPRLLQLFGNSSAVASSEQASRTLDALPAAAEQRILTKPIEDIRCGDRIPSQLPEGLEPEDEPEPDPATWRLVELEVDKPDGTRVEVKLLRPLTWLQQAGAIEHGTFPLNVEELDIDGQAAVLKILPCPPIQSGEGQVVTGTFRHTCDDLVELHIQGEPAPIVCTSGHPIWSEEAQDFVTAASLATSSTIRLVTGELSTVVAASRYSQENTVCNIEVNQSHCYYVGQSGLLAHNAGLDDCSGPREVPYRDPQRPGYNNGKVHMDHDEARVWGNRSPVGERPLPAETNMRRGGHDGKLYRDYKELTQELMKSGLSRREARRRARSAVQGEIDALRNSPPPRPMDPSVIDNLPIDPMDQ